MLLNYLQVINSVIGLIVNMLVQVISLRYISNLGLLKSVYVGAVTGLVSVCTVETYISMSMFQSLNKFSATLIANFIIYMSLCYCYFHFINLGETARRIRILREIYDSEEGLSMTEILERYNAKEIFEKRINRLLNNGQIVDKNGKYYIGNPVMLLIAKVIVTMKIFLIGKKCECECE